MEKIRIVEEQNTFLSNLVVYAFNKMNGNKTINSSSFLKAINDEVSRNENVYEVVSSNSDTIEVGSKFNATIDFYGKETNNYILSDIDIPVEGYIVITPSAPIAKAVMGKKENDSFSYDVNSHIINGTINKIIKPKVKSK